MSIMNDFQNSSVKDLQKFLKERGVSCANRVKAGLLDLCNACLELGVEVDPDGLVEDRSEVIGEKLTYDGFKLENPSFLVD